MRKFYIYKNMNWNIQGKITSNFISKIFKIFNNLKKKIKKFKNIKKLQTFNKKLILFNCKHSKKKNNCEK